MAVTRTIHTLVWIAWRGPIPKGKEIDHIDFDGCNNAIVNLQLLTKVQNRMRTVEANRHARGERHGQSKLSDADVREIHATYKKGVRGFGLIALAKKYGVCHQAIHYTILQRKG